MIDGWRKTIIGTEVTLQRGIDITRREQREGKVPVISSGGISSYHDTAAKKGPGVVIGRKGTLGTVFYVSEDYWPHDTTLWVKDFHSNIPRFVYYFFKSLRLERLDVGSANPTLNRNHVHPIQVLWPSVPIQRRIADILGALDDKIECNRRINQTLEAMAQAYFKHWFFDSDNTWESKPLDEVATFLNGVALQKYPPKDGASLPVIKIAELNRGITESSDRASADIPSKYIVADGDILFAWSGSLVVCIWCNGRGALNQHLFKVTSSDYPKWFYYQWIKYHLPEFRAIAAGKATTMGHIQREHLHQASVIVPPQETLQVMDSKMQPLLDQSISNNLEFRTLTRTRDYLLPKLLSGEVEVKAA